MKAFVSVRHCWTNIKILSSYFLLLFLNCWFIEEVGLQLRLYHFKNILTDPALIEFRWLQPVCVPNPPLLTRNSLQPNAILSISSQQFILCFWHSSKKVKVAMDQHGIIGVLQERNEGWSFSLSLMTVEIVLIPRKYYFIYANEVCTISVYKNSRIIIHLSLTTISITYWKTCNPREYILQNKTCFSVLIFIKISTSRVATILEIKLSIKRYNRNQLIRDNMIIR